MEAAPPETLRPGPSALMQGARFVKELTRGLAEPGQFGSLAQSAERSSKHNQQLIAAIPYFQSWREQAHQIKRYTLANLDKLLEEFERKITARGATVLYAQNAQEANEYLIRIIQDHHVRTVVKAKSMVSEEMELNHVLESVGVRAVETDLGEFLVQLAGQRPIHLVTPALHLSAADVGRLFQEKLGEPFTQEHAALTQIARKHLRRYFLEADLGISGVNFAIADVGAVCLVENEGNQGLSTSCPRVHVALMGIEKLIPSIRHLPVFLNLLGRSGTGQKLTTYTHLIYGSTPGRKLYVIVLDNGRTQLLRDPKTWTALFCIRCGACLNACPVYRRVGGWAYGWVYPGPIGAILTPQLVGLQEAGKLPFASSLCGACGEVCPVKIDIPHQLVHLRHRAVEEPSPVRSWPERIVWRMWAWAMCHPWMYRLVMRVVRLGTRLARFLPWHPGPLGAWTRGRELPEVPPGPDFRSWWKKHAHELKIFPSNLPPETPRS
ncbi:MAG: lactate utilization protein [Thermoguttaceae bacterium]|nr:lactate utilization protein [Thermoguttaceae bacterium]MDW8037241.1 lactate utilization protein B [Thermoguttaceae bacterium]